MENKPHKVLDTMAKQKIPYEIVEHPAVYTIKEMENLNIDAKYYIPKNLFLRDDKKRHYYLVVIAKNKQVDLKELRNILQSRPLSFASENDLAKYLGLTKGSVSPFGLLNDSSLSVELILDCEVITNETIGLHPNDNTATVFISPQNLEKIITGHGNPIRHLKL